MDRFELARRLILEAGELLRRERLEENGASQKTGHRDLVTRFDRETEQLLRAGISEAFPDDAIVGEELPRSGSADSGTVWYIDPIDGTTNFINQRRHFAVSIGCFENGEPSFALVLDVVAKELYSARTGEGSYRNGVRLRTSDWRGAQEMLLTTSGILSTFLRPHPQREGLVRLAEDVRGIRSLGSVALEICSVAAGEADLFIAMRSSPWDHNAARLILTEAGGSICNIEGGKLPSDTQSTVLAACSKDAAAYVLQHYLT